eukprot:3194554-Amphidinium_carterae.1
MEATANEPSSLWCVCAPSRQRQEVNPGIGTVEECYLHGAIKTQPPAASTEKLCTYGSWRLGRHAHVMGLSCLE